MDKLDKFYRTRTDFPDLMTDEEWNQKEIDIIKKQLEPQIAQCMKNLLQGIKCPLSVCVGYDAEGDISVKLSRNDKMDESGPKERDRPRVSRSESIGFAVRFPDGTVVQRRTAKDTLIATLKVIGLDRAAAFRGRKFADTPLVTRTRRTDGEAKWQEEVDGWYVYINMSNSQKIEVLRMLSKELHIGLVIKTEDGKTISYAGKMQEKGKRQMFTLDGRGPFNKRNCVWETVSKYMRLHPQTSAQQLLQKFPPDVQGSYGVVRSIQWVQHQQLKGKDFLNRFYIESDKVINTSDGEQMLVCNQWGDNFGRFIETAKELGFDIECQN